VSTALDWIPPAQSLFGGGDAGPWPPPKAEPFGLPWPLPPTTEKGSAKVWTRVPHRTSMGFVPPPRQDFRFIRAGAMNTRCDLPWLAGMPGNASIRPQLVTDLDIAKYGPGNTAVWDVFIAAKRRDGVNTIQISLGDFATMGWSIADTVAYGQYLRAQGFQVDLWVLNGGGPGSPWGPRDVFWEDIRGLVEPWVRAFIDAGVLTRDNGIVTVGWQLDGNASGSSLLSVIIGLGELVRGHVLYFSAHWLRDGNAWWDDGTAAQFGIRDRQSFWAFMRARALLNLTYPQYDVDAPLADFDAAGGPNGGAQGTLRDIERVMVRGEQFVCPCEYGWQDAFDHPELIPGWSQNMRGYGALTAGPPFVGYYGGATDETGAWV